MTETNLPLTETLSIAVRLNGELARLAGRARLGVTIKSPATVADLITLLASTESAIAQRIHQAVPVVDGRHATPDQLLSSGQEVALLMPIAGGTDAKDFHIFTNKQETQMATKVAKPKAKSKAKVKASTNGKPLSNGHPGHETVYVNQYVDGILDPNKPMLGPVRDGGHIIANTAPGCWGPMLTPQIRGGHEVTVPVAVAGAEVGDAIAIRIKQITVTSLATASGNDQWMENRFLGDAYVAGKCPGCGKVYPESVVEGIGETAIRCADCGADVAPFTFTNGYTIGFDGNRQLGVTLPKEKAEEVAHDAKFYAAMPEGSIQNSVLTFAPHHLVGLVARLRPFMGQLGTTPAIPLPDSHNAGDFGSFLIGAPHEYAVTAEELGHRTDGHMDIDAARAGAILICPVKTAGGGVYMGDMHALQGDGEIAGHTCDVSGTVTLQVHLLKGLNIDGPILFPVLEDLPFLAKPLTADEKQRAELLAAEWGVDAIEESAPISVVGTGPDLNAATDNGLERAAALLGVTVPEIKNRATITGAIEIGRHPGVVQVTFRAPLDKLKALGMGGFVKDMYGL